VLLALLLPCRPGLLQQLVEILGGQGASTERDEDRENSEAERPERSHFGTAFGAGIGAHRRSGAPRFVATRIASLTSEAYPLSSTQLRFSLSQNPVCRPSGVW